MRKLLYLLVIVLSLSACRDSGDGTEETQEEERFFNYQKMPKKLAINSVATPIMDEWAEFQELSSSFDVLYKAKNDEDLLLAIDDLIEKEKLLAKGTYPELFDKLQIKSRQRVLKTYMIKVKAAILSKNDTAEPTKEMIESYNALRHQFNIIVNNPLDKKLILNEE
ncbi:MAG: hypothetical protein AAF348_03695 [Bacteroidota bacterium]